MDRHLFDKWLSVAEKKAGLTKLNGAQWHAYRRKWASERKHLSIVDVAAAGGWRDTATLLGCYMQPDAVTLGGNERAAEAEGGRVETAPRVAPRGREANGPVAEVAIGPFFTQSGRRDLNPRPPEPHSGALPDCATSRQLQITPSNRGSQSDPLIRDGAKLRRGE
jgi:hypothetical protein